MTTPTVSSRLITRPSPHRHAVVRSYGTTLHRIHSRPHALVIGLPLMLLAISAVAPAQAIVFPASAAAPDQARQCLLRSFNQTTLPERKVFSQHGEDGVIESIFECIGTTNRQYVEFGVQDGNECSTRNLRENHKFTGLMMDGGYFRPEMNLQREFVYSWNIVQLFQKHKVPHPSFDQLTVDLDLNTFAVALAVLRGGYRPRSLTVEFNRNFAWSDPGYAVPDMPDEMWVYPDACEGGCPHPPHAADCYYSASVKAWLNMVASFGYHFVAADTVGVNLFFVHESAAGAAPLLTLDDAKRLATKGGEYPMLHAACSRHAWLLIPDSQDYSDASLQMNDLPVVLLSTSPQGDNNRQRRFHPTIITAGLKEKLASRPHMLYGPAGAAVPHRPGSGACKPALETQTVVAMALTAFVGGGLMHRFGSPLLLMLWRHTRL